MSQPQTAQKLEITARKKDDASLSNTLTKFREPWLIAAVERLRPIFADEKSGSLIIPQNLRCSFGLNTSGKKSTRKGECWPASASEDSAVEIFISPDIAEPAEVLAVLVYCLIHACLPNDAGHGPKYKAAANRIGLTGKMRRPEATTLLSQKLDQIAEALGPLPHARLDILASVLDRPAPKGRPRKQKGRMIKAECQGEGCGYTVRIAAKWARELGPPHCPKHGEMRVDLPAGGADDDSEGSAEGV